MTKKEALKLFEDYEKYVDFVNGEMTDNEKLFEAYEVAIRLFEFNLDIVD